MKEKASDLIVGRNPVMEALKAGREIEKLFVAKGSEGSIKKIIAVAKDRGIPVHYEDRQVLDKLSGNGNQGVAAFVSSHSYCEIEDMIRLAEERGEDPFVVVLDGIEDPHNLGAVIRTAEAAGAHGIVIPKRRAAGITSAVVKASAGASEHMLCAKVPNISQAIDKLKSMGLWIAACDVGGQTWHSVDLTGGIGLVVGGEGTGIGKLVREKCDFTLGITMKGKISSLNASNAAAILMYEVRRQRDGQQVR
ncbi:MAG: 23S rRNA (guanosine(2251)-2'-O)-methyltransferase RlmB [Clostridiales bacterium]|nr:23S rRNA (guanosine(2251)-2'-O)-methyltransferase RlmB [Clostridiales bacterium]